MKKYIPKVGEAFQFINDTSNCWVQCGKVIAETDTELAYLSASNGKIRTIKKERRFFPVSTKADVEREQLLSLMQKRGFFADRVAEIQQAGFTIPKKVERVDIFKLIHENECSDNYLTNEICKLLGDLVEQAKGGAK